MSFDDQELLDLYGAGTVPAPHGMVVFLIHLDLYLPLCHSLKDKRSVLKRTIHHLRRHYNVAVAETGANDKWGRAQLAVITICSLRDRAEETIRRVESYFETHADVQIVAVERELL